ncbi:hypothetical protein [Catellatospora tritici]|uniref:hypothetical protein n=1 Tax=Catellatospora tritici TaxID=2851566 RepID=UPI001C2D8B92|nr:hypothetical protein [Catellatospora tritici]MBV1853587.1 hypothetical protein [Catellatospora tritici]
MLAGVALFAAVTLSGLTSMVAYLSTRRRGWLVVAATLLLADCAVIIGYDRLVGG